MEANAREVASWPPWKRVVLGKRYSTYYEVSQKGMNVSQEGTIEP